MIVATYAVGAPVFSFGRVLAAPHRSNVVVAALLATVCSVPLQLWLLLPAARGRRVRYSGWVIAAFALINGAVFPIVGARWFAGAEQLAVLLAVFVRPRWSVPAVAALATAPAAMAAAGRNVALGRYFAQNTVFWSLLIATLIWLARVAAKLRASRQELANSAVMAERLRIDDELAASVGGELERLLAAGQRAARLASDCPAAAERELRSVTTYSRRALAKTRRMVSQYQAVTVRSEMATAMTLLAAAGSSAIQDVDSAVLDHALDSDQTAAFRSALTAILRDDANNAYLITADASGGRVKLDIRPRHPVQP